MAIKALEKAVELGGKPIDQTNLGWAYFNASRVDRDNKDMPIKDPDELLRTATAIGGRYMGADRAEEFGRRNGVPGELVVRIRPTKVIAELDMTT